MGAVLAAGGLNVVTRPPAKPIPPAAPLWMAAKPPVLAAASGSPPGRLKPPCPSRGLACWCVPPQQLGRAVGLKAFISCAVSAKPSALFVLSGCSRPTGEDSPCLTGGIPPNPLTSYYDDDFHILAEGNHHHNMRAKINTPILSTK